MDILGDILPKWKGRRLRYTKAAYRELHKLGMTLWDVKNVLEEGFECSRSKRKPGILERCVRKNGKLLKVVVKETVSRFPDGKIEDVWLILHVGKFGQAKKRAG